MIIIFRNWLIFEFGLTAVLWIPTLSHQTDIETYMDGFYLLRVVGALQYLRWMKDLQLIFQVLATTIYGISLFLVLVVLSFSYFAIAGVLMFKNSDPFHFKSFGRR